MTKAGPPQQTSASTGQDVAATNDADVAFSDTGTGEPLILIHGAHSDRRQFDVFVPLLGDGIRAIAYDQRDTPSRPCERDSYTMLDHAADCAAFIRSMGLRKAHILGTSYGGAIAMTTAIHHPDVVQSLVLASTLPSWSELEPAVAADLAEQDPIETERYMLGTLISQHALDHNPVLVAEARAGLCQRPPDMMARRFAALHAHDCRGTLDRIEVPTLVLHGTDDPLISFETAIWTAERIPGARIRLLNGGRHGLTLENRDWTAGHVRALILANRLEA